MFLTTAVGVIVLMFLLFAVVHVIKRRSSEQAHVLDRAHGAGVRDQLRTELRRLERENGQLRDDADRQHRTVAPAAAAGYTGEHSAAPAPPPE